MLACAVGMRRAAAQPTISDDLRTKVDASVSDILTTSGAPSASIAIVIDGRIAYTHAYGMARLASNTPATTAMRYSIGSISKQFTATAILLLAEDGKLALDDPVARWRRSSISFPSACSGRSA
jgi:D-alanyl-D-alanine carboxypeptidase